jgi:hypothetical protein
MHKAREKDIRKEAMAPIFVKANDIYRIFIPQLSYNIDMDLMIG